MQELSVIKKQKQDCKPGNECVRLLCDVGWYVRSEACIATKTQQLYPPFPSRVALTENLQNRQNSAVPLAPRHITQVRPTYWERCRRSGKDSVDPSPHSVSKDYLY